MAGGFTVTLLLALGMAWSIARLSAAATSQIERVRAEERQITYAERLRWNVEQVVSIGKGYVITSDPTLLSRLSRAEAEMRSSVEALTVSSAEYLAAPRSGDVQAAAARFDRAHRSLIAASRGSDDVPAMLSRFEKDVLPSKRELAASLDDLVLQKESALAELYRHATLERDRLASWMYGLLAILALAGSAITMLFAISVSRAYRVERSALETARKAISTREEILGIVAHDLRNPLNAITIKATLLQRIATAPMAIQQAVSIVRIASRMDHLIKGMLDLAMMEAGRFSIRTAPCDVSQVLGAITDAFVPLCAQKQITLRCVSHLKDTFMQADNERILQVLSNLLGNSLKFTPAGSEITVEAKLVHGSVQFSVTDQGPGIPWEQQQQIFDRFWRPGASEVKGTGLGLFIAKGIVEAHRGQIWLERSPEQGSRSGATFHFTVPAIPVKPTAHSMSVSEPQLPESAIATV